MSRKLELKKPRDHPINRNPLKVLGFHEFNEMAITDDRIEKSATPLSKRRGVGTIVTRKHVDYLTIAIAGFAAWKFLQE